MRPAAVRLAAALCAAATLAGLRPITAPSWASPNSTVGLPIGTTPSGRRGNGFAVVPGSGTEVYVWGGWGADSAGTAGRLNDMWRISWPAFENGSTAGARASEARWEWVPQAARAASIGVQSDMVGRYGALGVAGADLVPGARDGHVIWTDFDGDVWLFGGTGITVAGQTTTLQSNIRVEYWGSPPAEAVFDYVACVNPRVRISVLNTDYDSPSENIIIKINGEDWTTCYPSESGLGTCSSIWFDCVVDADVAAFAEGLTQMTVSLVNSPLVDGNCWTDDGTGNGNIGSYQLAATVELAGCAISSMVGSQNDLWYFDGLDWAWVHGSRYLSTPGVYTAADSAAIGPGGRRDHSATSTLVKRSEEDYCALIDPEGSFEGCNGACAARGGCSSVVYVFGGDRLY